MHGDTARTCGKLACDSKRPYKALKGQECAMHETIKRTIIDETRTQEVIRISGLFRAFIQGQSLWRQSATEGHQTLNIDAP